MNKKTLLILNDIEKLTGVTIVEDDMSKGPKLNEQGVLKLFKNISTTAGLLDNMVQNINKIADPHAEPVQAIFREETGMTHDNEALFGVMQALMGRVKTGMELEVAVREHYGMSVERPALDQFKEAVATLGMEVVEQPEPESSNAE